MITFEICGAGKFKLSMSRLSKITSNATLTLLNNKYFIKFDKGIIQDYGVKIVQGCVPEEGISFSFSTIKFHNLFKNFKGGNTFICNWDFKKTLKITPSLKTTREKKFESTSLKTTVTPVLTENLNFDFSLLENEMLPGELSIHQLIWIMEKLSLTFAKVNLCFHNSKISISSANDFYSGTSDLVLNTQSNINSNFSIISDSFLNLLWLIEFTSDIAYIFINPKTLELCLASKNDDNYMYIVL